MKPPAASPGRAEKQLPAPPGLARLLLSKSRRGGRSRRAPATSPMFVSRGRGGVRGGADGEPSSPKVTCIGQVRMRKGKKGKKGAAAAAPKAVTPEKARGYCRCLKKAFFCGGLFDFDRRRRPKAPEPEVERSRRSPWVFSGRDVAVAATPKQPDPRGDHGEEDEKTEASARAFGSLEGEETEELGMNGGDDKEDEEEEAELVSSATTTPPKNALLLMRCRSAPQNRSSPLTSRFPVAAPLTSPTKDAAAADIATATRASPSPRKAQKVAAEAQHEERQDVVAAVQEQEEAGEDDRDDDDEDDFDEEEEMRCSSARPLVLPRCKSEPATTAAAKMAGGTASDATAAGCFWANGGSSGRRRHAPPAAAPVALTGH
ncbi:hypothetical protein ABZP36_014430 [Zizania latifolia]